MIGALCVLGVYFIVEGALQIRAIHRYLEAADPPLYSLVSVSDPPLPGEDRPTATADPHVRLLASLEVYTVSQRYHQTSLVLVSQTWTRYMGLMTGMILVLVGSTFVLGKLQESTTRAEGSAGTGRIVLETASPGLVLAVMGTILIGISTFSTVRLDARDAPTYLAFQQDTTAARAVPNSDEERRERDQRVRSSTRPRFSPIEPSADTATAAGSP